MHCGARGVYAAATAASVSGLEAGDIAAEDAVSQVGAMGDVLMLLDSAMTGVDVSVTHPPVQPVERPQLPQKEWQR
jgi:hypothetical protein